MKFFVVHSPMLVSLIFLTLSFTQPVMAQQVSRPGDAEGAFLDPKYPTTLHTLPASIQKPIRIDGEAVPRPAQNDVEAIIAQQSAVKTQVSRGTCSIFSATALLESLMISVKGFPTTVDLSEEWLEYVTHLNAYDDGSNSWANFSAFAKYGSATEALWPYLGQEWKTLSDNPLAQERCGSVESSRLKACLIAHRDPALLKMDEALLNDQDPQFLKIRSDAFALRDQQLQSLKSQAIKSLATEDSVKALLLSQTPLTLDIDFYYGAWNHREATQFGIERNMEHWYKGIVGAPESGSLDERESQANPAGHSIVIVGYDDTVIVENQVQMLDGSVQTFTHKGVYYFKNSWATNSFGTEFAINGVAHPGYGMITQDYAHQYGTFFQMLVVLNHGK